MSPKILERPAVMGESKREEKEVNGLRKGVRVLKLFGKTALRHSTGLGVRGGRAKTGEAEDGSRGKRGDSRASSAARARLHHSQRYVPGNSSLVPWCGWGKEGSRFKV